MEEFCSQHFVSCDLHFGMSRQDEFSACFLEDHLCGSVVPDFQIVPNMKIKHALCDLAKGDGTAPTNADVFDLLEDLGKFGKGKFKFLSQPKGAVAIFNFCYSGNFDSFSIEKCAALR